MMRQVEQPPRERHRQSHDPERHLCEQLATLHEVSLKLATASSFDVLCRQAVELGRQHLGFERLGLWFTGDSPGMMVGSFGTDEQGETRDERSFSFHLSPESETTPILSGKIRSLRLGDTLHWGPGYAVVGRGTQVLGALWDGTRVIGFLGADSLLSGAPFSAAQEELLTQYAATIGHLCTRLRAEEALREAQATLEQRVRERTAALHERETQMLQVEKLRSLGEISAGIAHDLNNRLMAILGFAQLAQRETDLSRIRERLAVISQAAHDAAATVQRVRDFARQQSREDGQPIDLAAVAADALALGQPHWRDLPQERGVPIRLATELSPALALGHAAELRDAVFNLLQNAVQAMPEGGTLSIRSGVDGELPYLTVGDSGIGMTETVRRRCFDPFFTTRAPEGTGLGLATVYATVLRHSGELVLETAPDQGTTIGFRLPRAPGAARAAASPEPGPSQQGRVLVVEDEPLVRGLLQEMLSRAGYQVQTAPEAGAALELLEGTAFDLVITDQGMPGIPGTELAARLKDRHPDMAVLLLTGWGDETLARVQSSNVRGVLAKPLSEEALLQAVADALQSPSRRP
jgi:two-component system cell cycle sensor histidine kinase/response regulator CckA